MEMQFEFKGSLLGIKRQVVEQRVFCNAFLGEVTTEEDKANGSSGLQIRKIPIDEAVINMLPDYKPQQVLTFLAVLKSAAGGKSQPHIIGIVPAKLGQEK